MDENNPPPVPPVEVPTENNLPPGAPPAPVQAPPPAAHLVMHGTKSEREIQLERENAEIAERVRVAEFKAAELERDNQELKKIPKPREPKPKRERNWSDPVFDDDED